MNNEQDKIQFIENGEELEDNELIIQENYDSNQKNKLLKRKKPIFAYCYSSAWGYIDDLFIFSIKVFDSGLLVYKSKYEPHTHRFKLKQATIDKITKIIEKRFDTIREIEPVIYNGTDDGGANKFIFLGKEIIDFNIEVEELKSEKLILKTFRKVANVLKEEGFYLSLEKFRYDDKTERL